MRQFFRFTILLSLAHLHILAQDVEEATASYPKHNLEVINSSGIEARPFISPDGNTLYFCRRNVEENQGGKSDEQDVYVSERDPESGAWKAPVNLGKGVNDKRRNALASISPDGTTGIFFNTYRRTRSSPLVRMRKTDKGWSKPQLINIRNYVNVNDYADYYLDFDQNVLFLAIESDSSIGGQDIHIAFPDGYGGWNEPQNLGNVINSTEADFAPFLGADGRSLFFCSYGHEGLGASDIFMSVRLDDTWLRWSEPVNLGPAINSDQEETYFSITSDFKYLYYAQYARRGNDRDIIQLELPEDFTAINGPVLVYLDSASIRNIMLSGNYQVNPQGRTRNFEGTSFEGWPEYEDTTVANAGDSAEVAGMVAKMDSTEYSTEEIPEKPMVATGQENNLAYLNGFVAAADAGELSPEAEAMRASIQNAFPDLDLLIRKSADKVEFKLVQNLLYDFNSVFVRSDYLPRLSRMARLLRSKSALKMQLIGHTDNIGAPEVNKRVARQRVGNIEYYLKERGIEDARVEVISYGQEAPLQENSDAEARQQNRRVETILIFNTPS